MQLIITTVLATWAGTATLVTGLCLAAQNGDDA
jgi:hypothetical protein